MEEVGQKLARKLEKKPVTTVEEVGQNILNSHTEIKGTLRENNLK